ncbi:MAG: sigma-70 family RNA polymerase sigma factor [Ruminococcaceae bacterium]|nr:sigma-70 family RNA polymerase sigma factor [Oscillospiraceae bacterium]
MTNHKRIRPDHEIVALYLARDEEAIAATDTKYGGYLFTVAYNILHDPLDCEECRNDTYLKTWCTIPPKRPARLQAYLTRIIRCISVDRYRERTREKRIPSDMTVSLEELSESLASHGEWEIETAELGRCISDYVASLPRRRRLIFVCRYYCADPPGRIADMLGVTVSAVYKELGKIRAGLREHLEKEGFYL